MKPRILHLAYEDPDAPGAGGGSVRTHEINSRLGDRFRITAVSVRHEGAIGRVVDGTRYAHLGVDRGHKFARQLSYFAALPRFVARHADAYDLVVEDFGAPFGTVGLPRFTRRPTIGVVQWLFAKEKSRQYHVPFHHVESFGLRRHTRLIAVSSGIGEEILRRNPAATVDVIPNGLPDIARQGWPDTTDRRDFLFIGRLDIEHKGLDMLMDAYSAVSDDVVQGLDIAGDGPGEAWLRDRIATAGLGDRVRLLGRVASEDRFEVMRRYDAVIMPSRYESFGMVAAEAAATGTPVIAFDIPCLRDLIAPELLVPQFDVGCLATTMVRLGGDAAQRRSIAARLPAMVADLSWETLADRQAQVYDDVLSQRPVGIIAPT